MLVETQGERGLREGALGRSMMVGVLMFKDEGGIEV